VLKAKKFLCFQSARRAKSATFVALIVQKLYKSESNDLLAFLFFGQEAWFQEFMSAPPSVTGISRATC